MAEQFQDLVEILDANENVIIILNAKNATATVGATGKGGHLSVIDSSGVELLNFDSASGLLRLGASGQSGSFGFRPSSSS